MIRRRVLAAVTLVAALLLAGCTSSDSLAQQYRDGNEKGYIAGDFQIVEISFDDVAEWVGEPRPPSAHDASAWPRLS